MTLFGFAVTDLWFFFILYSFLGWLMETALVSIKERRFVNRGFLFGPICPIYGVGMVLILLLCSPFKEDVLLLFIVGFVIATTVEFATSLVLEWIFDATWWDYSDMKCNIQGRICLQVSLFWGVLALVNVAFIQPFLSVQIRDFPLLQSSPFFYVTVSLFSVDLLASVFAAGSLRYRVETIIKQLPDFDDLMHYTNDSAEKLPGTYGFKSLVDHIKNNIEHFGHDHSIVDYIDQIKNRKADYTARFDRTIKSLIDALPHGEKRLLKAFPKMSFKKIRDYFDKEK